MNTKSIYTVGKCLLLLLLIFTGYACEDNDEGKENTSAPVLISCNINGTEVDLANIDSETENNLTAGTDGYVEFVFSKAMRQTPPTKDEETGEVLTTGIYFNDKVASNQIVINYEKSAILILSVRFRMFLVYRGGYIDGYAASSLQQRLLL